MPPRIAPTVILLVVVLFSAPAWSGWFGPSNYDECIQENLKGVQSNLASKAIISICKRKYSDTKNSLDTKDYPADECIMENLKNIKNDVAARAIIKMCNDKFPHMKYMNNNKKVAPQSDIERILAKRRAERLAKMLEEQDKQARPEPRLVPLPDGAQSPEVNIEKNLEAGGIGIPELLALLLIAFASLPAIFYCLTLRKALLRCSPDNRRMKLGLLWLFFVPVFNVIWNFVICINIDMSLKQEYETRKIPERFKSTRTVGMAYCILAVFSFIPAVGVFSGIAAVIFWIVFWFKVAGLSRGLAPEPATQ